ncbi:PTS sugar transporter subunit IIA [Chlamydiota bacterium]
MPNLSEIVSKDLIVEIMSSKKDNVLKEMIYSLSEGPLIDDINAFYKAVLEREQLISTGIGYGMAIPHAKLDSVSNMFMMVGRKREGIDFDSVDGKPVYIVCMIGGSDKSPEEMLQILAQVFLTFKNETFKNKIINAVDTTEIYHYLKSIAF